MKMRIIILIIVIGLIVAVPYFFPRIFGNSGFFSSKTSELSVVTKVIDGDTVIVEGGRSVRLLGIDADEKGYACYNAAKLRIEELVLNQKVYLESDGDDKDMYKRYLRYIILDNENINVEMVKEGLAVARILDDSKYKDEIINAEKYAMDNSVGCKWG